jgi:hypothetical protein
MALSSMVAAATLSVLASYAGLTAAGATLTAPLQPAVFFPRGVFGLQPGNSWASTKKNPVLEHLACQAIDRRLGDLDEVCFFRTSSAGRVAGAKTRDGFIVRKGDQLVLIGTGISIKNADDPLAEAVMQNFESQVNSRFQRTGSDVLFVTLPARHLSPQELLGYSQTTPVLLVQLEHEGNELAVLYGYLAPVNAFDALTADR